MSKVFFNNKRINDIIQTTLNKDLEEIKYAYAIMSKKNPLDMVILNNHSVWFEYYLKNNYQLIDPVIITSLERVEDFRWDDKIVIASELTLPKIFFAAKQHDIKKGHTFVLHDNKSNLAILSIYENILEGSNVEEYIALNKEKLQALLISTHQKLLSLYLEFETVYHQKKPIISPRENEILYWASQGKTYQEIAIILGIKHSTVKFHIKNIVTKLGVSNAKHAITLAVESHLIQRPREVLQKMNS